MAKLTGTGAPSAALQAAIGDIYTDESTGKKYKCTFALRLDDSQRFDTQWTELKNDVKPKITINGKKIGEAVSKPAGAPVNTNFESEKISDEKIDENKADEEKPVQQPKKNYTDYSKPKNK